MRALVLLAVLFAVVSATTLSSWVKKNKDVVSQTREVYASCRKSCEGKPKSCLITCLAIPLNREDAEFSDVEELLADVWRCGPVCRNVCPNGRVLDSKGCPTCTCKQNPTPKRCGPVCRIACPYGNVLDSKGCPTCACKKNPTPKRCGPVCRIACPYGKVLNSEGCPICVCKKKPTPKRCGPVCRNVCPYGRVLNSEGCPTCTCKQNSTSNQVSSDTGSFINQRGLNLIKEFEGFRSCVYKDAVGLPTIGYGHLIKTGESFTCITEAQAESLLRSDVATAESCVSRNVKVALNSNQFSALVSFTFNVGCGNFQSSTLLKRLNTGEYAGVCPELARWNKAGGQVLPGLTRRREAECNLFNAL